MGITLKCKYTHAQTSFGAKWINGHHVPQRIYQVVDGLVTIEGYAEDIIHHDVDEMLAFPEGLYRMLTPHEQEQLASAKQQASQVQESAPEASSAPIPGGNPSEASDVEENAPAVDVPVKAKPGRKPTKKS